MNERFRALKRPDGASIAYGIVRAEAPRPLLVLAHGMGSNMTRWSEFFAETTLKASWDLLRLDLRGHGASPWRGRTGMEIWIDDLAAILDAEGYARAVVGGHCLGANLALDFAHRKPDRARGLVLIEPMPPAAQAGAMRAMQPLAPLLRLAAAAVRAANAFGIRRRRIEPLDLRELDKTTRATMAAQKSAEAMTRIYASPFFDLRYMTTAAYLEDLVAVWRALPPPAAIRVPSLVLVSTGRHFIDPALAQRAMAAIPRLTLKRVEALHWIPTEQPTAMREAIERWCGNLERTEPQGA